MIQNTKILHHITASYVLLLSMFGVALIAGTIKTTLDPDEKVYAPGKYVTLYNPIDKTFVDARTSTFKKNPTSKNLQTNTFTRLEDTPSSQCN